MPPSVFQPGHCALITGGASGIGLALAKKCIAEHGMRVLVADRDDELLRAAPRHIFYQDTKNTTPTTNLLTTVKADVGKPADWAVLRARADEALGGKVHLLALNAGVAPPSDWSSPDAFRAILDTNLYGVVHGITTFLDTVQSTASPQNKAAIVITGSKQGITNPPGNPAYNASKAAVRALAEHLSFDLRAEQARLSVHLLVPGWTFTGLSGNRPGGSGGDHQANKEKPDGAWWPEQVVDFAVPKIDEGQFWILCPDGQVTEELVSFFFPFLPSSFLVPPTWAFAPCRHVWLFSFLLALPPLSRTYVAPLFQHLQ